MSIGLLALAVRFGWLGADVGRGANFCEAARDGWVKQPANTLSNLGFVVAGLAVGWRARFPEHLGDTLPRLPGLATGYACLVVLLGPASAAMHATQSSLGGLLDMTSMYLIASFAAAYAMTRWRRRDSMFFWQVFVVLVAACELIGRWGWEVPVVHRAGNAAFALLLVAVIGEGIADAQLSRFTRENGLWVYVTALPQGAAGSPSSKLPPGAQSPHGPPRPTGPPS